MTAVMSREARLTGLEVLAQMDDDDLRYGLYDLSRALLARLVHPRFTGDPEGLAKAWEAYLWARHHHQRITTDARGEDDPPEVALERARCLLDEAETQLLGGN